VNTATCNSPAAIVGLPNRGASGDNGIVRCKERLGGLLKYYEREAA
jgi:hypothetical protein